MFRGNKVGEYFDGVDTHDVIVKFSKIDDLHTALKLPLYSPRGNTYTLDELSHVQLVQAPSEIVRINGQRARTIWVQVPDNWTISAAQQAIASDFDLAAEELAGNDVRISYAGSAGELSSALDDMAKLLGIAILMLFLIVFVMFQSIKDSLIVLMSIPLSLVGGVIGIRIASEFWGQSLDILAIVGFLILIGLVVNNSILLVKQFRVDLVNSSSVDDALTNALAVRLRPILLTTITTVAGMLPLLFVFGEGSEVYRGLAIVLVGGMIGSTVLSLCLTPCLLRLANT